MGSTVLLLEDSATQARIIGAMISKLKWAVVQANDVETALKIAERTPVGLMLLDVYVGQVSSLAHLEQFRKHGGGTPIGIMTAGKNGVHSAAETLAHARRGKVEFLLAKPFGQDELESVLKAAELDQVRVRAPRVLVVDDSGFIRNLCRRTLEAEGLIVADAATMEEALARMDVLRIDLVITDIFMPGMGGIAGIGKIRKEWPMVPIVAMTSGLEAQLDASTALRAAEQVGAVGMLPKPFQPEALANAVFELLDDRAKVAAAGAARLRAAVELI